MRELAGEIERKKNGGRKKRSRRERENRKCIFNWRGERIVIKKFFFFFTCELQCTSIFRCAL